MINSLIRPLLFLGLLMGLTFLLTKTNNQINVERKEMSMGIDSIIMVPKSNVTILQLKSSVSKVSISDKFHAGILDKTKVTISRLKVADELGYIEIHTKSKVLKLKLKCSNSNDEALVYKM